MMGEPLLAGALQLRSPPPEFGLGIRSGTWAAGAPLAVADQGPSPCALPARTCTS